MYLKWVGLALLIVSLILGLLMATNAQVSLKTESYAQTESDKTPMVDRVVPVPPWNRTEGDRPWGWVGFNMTLPNQGKMGYEAYGVILPNDPEEQPKVLMRIVNATPGGGFDLLIFDKFSEQAWNASRVYAVAELPSLLNPNQYYNKFWLYGLDNASKYCVFFRGIANRSDDFHILMTIKESWFEQHTLIPTTAPYMAVVGTIGVAGSSLIAIGFAQTRKRRFHRKLTNTTARKS